MVKNTIRLLACGGLLISGAVAAPLPTTRCMFSGYYDGGQILVIDARLSQGPWLNGDVSGGWGTKRDAALRRAPRRDGVDITATAGSPVYATAPGVVEEAANDGAGGKRVLVRYGGDLKVGYTHLQKIGAGVMAGKPIARGQVIGTAGSKPVLVSIYYHGAAVEPMGFCSDADMPLMHFKDLRVWDGGELKAWQVVKGK